MCQHRVTVDKEEYFYGFDHVAGEYFMFKDFEDGESELVGYGGERPGTHGHMLEAIEEFNLTESIPARHITNIGLDLPCCNV